MQPRTATASRAAAALIVLAVAACGPGRVRPAPRGPRFEFQHGIELFQTTSGMRFALVRDARTNLATIDVRYDVGAAADPPGLAGLAHLVEHLTFEVRATPGGPTLGDELEQLSLYTNATTTADATHYTSTVPAGQLARAIALEGARMAATCEQLDDALLERERDVVLAEEAERASPAADLLRQLEQAAYGADHPYAREVGSREVARATRGDVCAFVEAHYAPERAYLVVTGPFEVDEVRGLVGRTFGPIARHATAARAPVPPPRFAGESRRIAAPVRNPAAVVLFDYPAWGSTGALRHALGARLLAAQLELADEEEPWIVGTGVTVLGGPRAPVLAAIVEVAGPDRLDSAADEVFARAARLREYDELGARSALASVVLEQVSRWDDLMGRGSWIADFLQYADHDWFMLEDLRAAAEGWTRHRDEVSEHLRPEHARIVLVEHGRAGRGRVVDVRSRGTHDLTPWRAAVDPAEADRPLAIERTPPPVAALRYTLGNGLSVELAPDPASPLVDARLVFPVGTAHQPEDQPLLAVAAAALLAEPPAGPGPVLVRSIIGSAYTSSREVDEISTTFALRGLAEASDGFVRSLAGTVQRGRYDARVLSAVKGIARDLDDEPDEAEVERDQRFRQHLFGVGHPYAAPPIAVGPALASVDVSLLDAWRADHLRARGATLIVSGRFDPEVVKRDVQATFGAWPGGAPEELPDVSPVRPPPGPSWLATEDHRASQVRVRVGFTAGSHARWDRAARAVLAAMIVDELRDVREGLGASYGVRGRYVGGSAGSALLVEGAIDEARAGVAVPRLLAAIERLRDDEAARRAAFVRARRRVLGEVQARVAGATRMADELESVVRGGVAAADLDRQAAEIARLTIDQLTAVARRDLDRAQMVVELRGRREAAAAGFAALAVTPAWLGELGSDDVAGADGVTPGPRDVPAPAPRPSPPTAPTAPRPPVPRPAAVDVEGGRLALGGPHSATGPRTPGLYQGGRAISLDAFLRVSGHGDLADDVRDRRRLRIGMVAGGATLLAASVVYGLATVEDCDPLLVDRLEFEACEARNRTRKGRVLGGVVLGGVAAAIGANLSNLRPTDAALRKFADEHNYRHRRDRAAARDVVLRPLVTGDSVGLVLDGAF